MNKKIIFLSPILGSIIATILMVAYAAIKVSMGFSDIFALIQTIPLIFLTLSILSYVISLPVGWILIKWQYNSFFSDGIFIFLACLCGIILGGILSILNFRLEESIFKAFFIFTATAMAATFNASFYVTLRKNIKELEKA